MITLGVESEVVSSGAVADQRVSVGGPGFQNAGLARWPFCCRSPRLGAPPTIARSAPRTRMGIRRRAEHAIGSSRHDTVEEREPHESGRCR